MQVLGPIVYLPFVRVPSNEPTVTQLNGNVV